MKPHVIITVGARTVCVELDVPEEAGTNERIVDVLVASVRLGAALLDAGVMEYPVQGTAEEQPP